METAVKIPIEEVLDYRPRIRKKPWFNEKCKEAIDKRDKAHLKMALDPTDENKRTLAIRQREAKRIIMMNKRLCEKEKVQGIEKNRRHITRIFFEKANEVRRGFKSRHTMIRMEDGSTENDEIANALKNMFQALLNQLLTVIVSEEHDIIEQYIERPTIEEVEIRLQMIKKNRKSPAADDILPECLIKERRTIN